MKEREVLRWLAESVLGVGDDCAVIPFADTHLVLTTDMLWEKSDFPVGSTPYAIGWRTVAVSLSDIAAMGARPLGVVVALGAPEFEGDFLNEILQGGLDCCKTVDAPYVGGDLSKHSDLTLTSSAVGEARSPVLRSGAQVGDLVCVTGKLGRTAAALELFEQGNMEKANKLFGFTPRVSEGLKLAPFANSMMDISDGLARSLHQMSEASAVGFRVSFDKLPITPEILERTTTPDEILKLAIQTGEDFELLFTIAERNLKSAERNVDFAVVGEVIEKGVKISTGGATEELEDIGYEH